MKFSQFIEDSSLSFHSTITQEEWDRITDVELENTKEITFKTPSGKQVPFRKVKYGEWRKTSSSTDTYECSLCGLKSISEMCSPFCPLCGADMSKTE